MRQQEFWYLKGCACRSGVNELQIQTAGLQQMAIFAAVHYVHLMGGPCNKSCRARQGHLVSMAVGSKHVTGTTCITAAEDAKMVAAQMSPGTRSKMLLGLWHVKVARPAGNDCMFELNSCTPSAVPKLPWALPNNSSARTADDPEKSMQLREVLYWFP